MALPWGIDRHQPSSMGVGHDRNAQRLLQLLFRHTFAERGERDTPESVEQQLPRIKFRVRVHTHAYTLTDSVDRRQSDTGKGTTI